MSKYYSVVVSEEVGSNDAAAVSRDEQKGQSGFNARSDGNSTVTIPDDEAMEISERNRRELNQTKGNYKSLASNMMCLPAGSESITISSDDATMMSSVGSNDKHQLAKKPVLSPGYLKYVQAENKRKRALPNVLLIGAQKSGTTALASWLFDNGVCSPARFAGEPSHFAKEVHFFDNQLRYKEGIEFYAKRFQHCDDRKFAMDATPETLLWPHHVHETYGRALPSSSSSSPEALSDLGLIVILREPISRELSRYNHMKQEFLATTGDMTSWFSNVAFANGTVMSFDRYVDTVLAPNIFKDSWRWMSKYVDNLRRWIELFDRNKLLVLSYDELQQDPESVQWRIKEFLGCKFTGELRRRNSKGKYNASVSECVRRALGPRFAAKNEELYQFLEKHPGPWMEQRPFPRFEDVEADGTLYPLEESITSTSC